MKTFSFILAMFFLFSTETIVKAQYIVSVNEIKVGELIPPMSAFCEVGIAEETIKRIIKEDDRETYVALMTTAGTPCIDTRFFNNQRLRGMVVSRILSVFYSATANNCFQLVAFNRNGKEYFTWGATQNLDCKSA